MNENRQQLLRIYLSEGRKYEGLPLHEWLLKKARDSGMAGATILRGMAGYGVDSQIHTAKILTLSQNLPLVIELVDSSDKVDAYLDLVDDAIDEGLATVEEVKVRFYRG